MTAVQGPDASSLAQPHRVSANAACTQRIELIDALNRALPQTQCTRCAYPDCRSYATAMADGEADINQCPPGGREGIGRLARITGRPEKPLNATHGTEGPRLLAVIDEAWCIGCTLCLSACPVDAIVGGPKAMHTVIDALCTGCELCIPACPVDCISLANVSGERSGWQAWSHAQADEAAQRYDFHRFREARDETERNARLAARARPIAAAVQAGITAPLPEAAAMLQPDLTAATPTAATPTSATEAKRALIAAAMARARERKPA